MQHRERLEEFKLKVETYDKFKEQFIGSASVNNIQRFLKKLDTPLSWLFLHALDAEVSNIEAKRELLLGSRHDSFKYYRLKHIHINAFIKRIIEWNDVHKDKMILYGGARDRETSIPTVLFNLPNTEQISWHDNTNKEVPLPKYPLPWDAKINSTLMKIRQGIINNFAEELKARRPNDNIEVIDFDINIPNELYERVRSLKSYNVLACEQEIYLRKQFCKEGVTVAMHHIKQNQKETPIEQRNDIAPMFLLKMIQTELDRLQSHVNGTYRPNTNEVNELITNFNKCIQKKRFKDQSVKVKKVRSCWGKYLVTFDATMNNDAHIVFSLYSQTTPLTRQHPSWIKRNKADNVVLPENNTSNLESFTMSYIKQYIQS